MRASSWSNRLAPWRTSEAGYSIMLSHAVGVGVRDKTVVRPIVMEFRPEVNTNEAKVVLSFSTGSVKDDERPARCDRV